MIKKLYLSWQETETICKLIIRRIKSMNFVPDVIITPLRGGVIPAVIISHKINLQNLITVMAQRTKDDSIEVERKEVILNKLPTVDEIRNKNVLILDEIADSGDTLQEIYNRILKMKPKKIITAVLFTNSKRFKRENRIPDISIKKTDKWVVFPWE